MSSFTERLTDWYRANKRDLPWRRSSDPYPVWLSEIILQQTRVDQGLPYWERFMEAFPRIEDLAEASEDEVLRHWQGLGYYSRARNLHATAKYIANSLHGHFPDNYIDLLQLKGVGPYTAAAIASFCFSEPRPVVDGNVFRFISRHFGVTSDISASGTRKEFEQLLSAHIPRKNPGDFNQALMEYGATVCSPAPQCPSCALSDSCYALEKGMQKQLPIKLKKTRVRDRYLNYLVIKCNGSILLKPREEKDVWKGLYDFYLIEGQLDEESVLHQANEVVKGRYVVEHVSEEVLHLLSHQKLRVRFYELDLNDEAYTSAIQKTKMHAFSYQEILNLPKPKLIVNYLEQRGLN